MDILVGCECSGAIRSRLRNAGHNAWSTDLKPSEDDSPHHIVGDIMDVIPTQQWDLIIAHPVCTAMALSGNRWYGTGMPRNQERQDAIQWTLKLWKLACKHSDRVALENPMSVIFPELRKLGATVQWIQPWQYGHGECKRTGFATIGLPELVPTDIVEGREQRIWKMGPSPTRTADRSRTYSGIAEAIVDQWGNV
jgi:hypothetical protein